MFFFWHKYKVTIIFCILVVLSTGLLIFPHIPLFRNCKSLLIYLISPSQKISVEIFQTGSNFWRNVKELIKAKEENIILHNTIMELKQTNNQLLDIGLENERLKKLLGLKDKLPYSTIAARVIARAPLDLFSTVLIDKGEQDGVTVNMPVVTYQNDNQGVVGRVCEVMSNVSKVSLITDPVSRINAMVRRTRFDGIIEGSGEGEKCQMNYLRPDADILNGDIIITSARGSVFPEGLVIGEVIATQITKGRLYKSAKISPVIDLTRLEEVLIIKK